MDKIIVNKVNEIIYHKKLENGLEVYIYKKPGFYKKKVYFTTKYGSNDFEFALGKNEKIKTYPKGIAHFLEHKLFESNDDENIFKKFEKYGAYVNAYTNHIETTYHFSCTENFEECLELLLDFVQTPYFTDENVEKEKGIIEQEIDMTNDRIDRTIYHKTLELVLLNDPNINDTIGDKENINKITKEDLYECYNAFYHPSNMILTIAGDVDVRSVIRKIEENQSKKKFDEPKEIILKEYSESNKVVKEYENINENVTTPRISICYKMIMPNMKGREKFKTQLFLNMFLGLKFGSTSNFKRKLIDEKIIKTGMAYDYEIFGNTILIIFESDVIDKEKFISLIEEKLFEQKFDENLFDLNKKIYLSSMVKAFENPAFIASKIFMDIIRYGEFINDAYDLNAEFTFDVFKEEIKKLNFDNKAVLYVTSNKEE